MARRAVLGLSVSSAGAPKPAAQDAQARERAAALSALQAVFGFPSFRALQEEAITAALAGRDAFVLLPTGGGKSLCYTIPALVRRGTTTLVVSPLLALIEDQVGGLRRRGVCAERLSSSLTAAERRAVLADIQSAAPRTQLLFATPELLATPAFMDVLRGLYSAGKLLLAAVDEAHCISTYGADFRPTYSRLGALRRELPRLPIMALTATASARVQEDIASSLLLRSPLRLTASFDRPNLSLEVRYLELLHAPDGGPAGSPLADLLSLLREGQPPGQQRVPCAIVYCLKRETADGVAAHLARRGVAAAPYHAGLPDVERSRVLADWTARRVDVVVGTVAFGMGIDRSDVRLVVHYNLPRSLEGYYQEAGRAGRDGAPARCICYFSTADRQAMEFLLGRGGEGTKPGGDGGRAGGGQREGLQAFGGVVEYCMRPRCRRAALLAHFGEALPPGHGAGASAACCDVCADPGRIAGVLQELALAGAQRQQAFLRARHVVDLQGPAGAGGDRAGGVLDFERERPGEGLDFDGEAAQQQAEEGESEDDGDSENEGAEEARAAAKRARRGDGGLGGVMAALEAAEAAHAAADARGGSHTRLLSKLEGGGSLPARPAPAPRAPAPLSAAQLDQQVDVALAAAAGPLESPAAVQRAVQALRQLQRQPVTAALLQQTGAGKRVRGLEKHLQPSVAEAAAAVVGAWKERLLAAQQ